MLYLCGTGLASPDWLGLSNAQYVCISTCLLATCLWTQQASIEQSHRLCLGTFWPTCLHSFFSWQSCSNAVSSQACASLSNNVIDIGYMLDWKVYCPNLQGCHSISDLVVWAVIAKLIHVLHWSFAAHQVCMPSATDLLI